MLFFQVEKKSRRVELMTDLICDHCAKPIRTGVDVPVVIEWKKKDKTLPDHIGREVQRGVHLYCNQEMKGTREWSKEFKKKEKKDE